MAEEYVEGIVCKDCDVKENEMKVFPLKNEYEVLMVRQDGKLHALGSRCTHYDAPMVTGALGKGCIRCPWHGARFNINNGDIEDFPGLDSLPTHHIEVCNGEVKVRAKKSELQSSRRVKFLHARDPCDRSVFVIIGGGPSAAVCAETLRQNRFHGEVIMITEENALPYDRVVVSKALGADVNNLLLRTQEFYDKNNIQVKKGLKVTKVDTRARSVTLSNGEVIHFTSLYIATGCRPRSLDIENRDLKNIFTVRNYTDNAAINNALGPNSDKNVVILGSSFIGMEMGSICVGKAKSVTIIGRDEVPLQKLVGKEIGGSFMKLFEENGIHFRMKNKIKSLLGRGGYITHVKLSDGTLIEADLLILGIGSNFNTEFLRGSDIEIDADGSLPVDNHLQTRVRGVYAGGDVAKAPISSFNNIKAAIGHFGLAQLHGKTAALNMAGTVTPLKAVPFFWTRPFNHGIIYCGHGKYEDVKIMGNVEKLKFVAYYLDKDEKIIAMASCQWDKPIVSQFAELLQQGKVLHWSDVTENLFS